MTTIEIDARHDHLGVFDARDDQLGAYEADAPVRLRARCADGNGTLTPLFFSDHLLDIARAKAICAKCALRAECLAGALEREEPWGVWGGELLASGRIVTSKRPCGRPPKRPRPELVVDEMGIVVQTIPRSAGAPASGEVTHVA